VIEILGTGDQSLDFVGAEHDRQTKSLFWIGQVLADVPPVQHVPTEEPKRANLCDDRPNGQPPLLKQEQVVASQIGGSNSIEARARVLAERFNDLDVAADGRGGVVAAHQLVAQALQ